MHPAPLHKCRPARTSCSSRRNAVPLSRADGTGSIHRIRSGYTSSSASVKMAAARCAQSATVSPTASRATCTPHIAHTCKKWVPQRCAMRTVRRREPVGPRAPRQIVEIPCYGRIAKVRASASTHMFKPTAPRATASRHRWPRRRVVREGVAPSSLWAWMGRWGL